MSDPRSRPGLVAVITTDPGRAHGGAATILIARDRDEMEQFALRMAKLVRGMIHELAEDLVVVAVH